jgi:hypothetical protein
MVTRQPGAVVSGALNVGLRAFRADDPGRGSMSCPRRARRKRGTHGTRPVAGPATLMCRLSGRPGPQARFPGLVNGVHLQAVEPVYQSLGSVYEEQVLVATHFPVPVGPIQPAQLLCFSRTAEGETDIVTGDQHPKLKNWKNGVLSSRLYAAGILS